MLAIIQMPPKPRAPKILSVELFMCNFFHHLVVGLFRHFCVKERVTYMYADMQCTHHYI
jgi:hypothetical protein